MNFLIQPKKYKSLQSDACSRAIMEKTIAFFENMGKERLLDDYIKKVWYREFIDFIARERIFSKLLTINRRKALGFSHGDVRRYPSLHYPARNDSI